MAKENIVNYSLRFNLDNEQHLRVYQLLNKVDSDVYGSRNKFIIQALDEYFRGGGNVGCEEETSSSKDDKEQEEFLERVFEKTQEAVLRTLGSFYAGGGVSSYENEKVSREEENKEVQKDDGVTNMEVLGLIDMWNG